MRTGASLGLILLSFLPATLSRPADTPPVRCSTRPILKDPSFESSSPVVPFPPPSPPPSTGWYIGSVAGSSTFTITKPGSPPIPPDPDGGDKQAFTMQLIPNINSKGYSGIVLDQNMNLCPGKNYSVIMDFRFKAVDTDNNCHLIISYPFPGAPNGSGRGSVDTGSAILQAGVWYNTASTFPAGSLTSGLFEVYGYCRYGVKNEITVDNVRVQQFNGNA